MPQTLATPLDLNEHTFFAITSDSHWIKPSILFSKSQQVSARYHIFAANPARIELLSNTSDIDKLKRYPSETPTNSQITPFTTGWIGYFDYVQNLATDPKDAIKGEFHYHDWSLIFDRKEQTCTLYSQLSATKHKALQLKIEGLVIQTNSEHRTANTNFECSSFEPIWSKTEYQSAFKQVQDYLKAGDCYQINLTQPHQARYSGDIKRCINRIANQLSPEFAAYFEAEEATLLSASPERFIEIQNGIIETKPIKGTIKSSDHPDSCQQDLINQLSNSEKDKAENLMIVDLLRNDLGKIADVGSVNVEKLFDIESHPYVHHMVSTIKAIKTENVSNPEAILSCFPGGSITGAPKKRAMEIINELEAMPRSAYCGSLGYFSDNGRCDFNILIRTLEFKPVDDTGTGEVYCWGGGGITIASEMESEYQESLDKITKLMKLIESQS